MQVTNQGTAASNMVVINMRVNINMAITSMISMITGVIVDSNHNNNSNSSL